MLCPRDRQELQKEVFAGVDIDSCTCCDGTWLDAGETARVIGINTDLPTGREVPRDKLGDRYPGARLNCPRCDNVAMTAYYYSGNDDLIVDRCPQCKGMWLDNGEIRSVLAEAYKEFGA